MEKFTNETIDTTQLPKFEEVPFSKLDSRYLKVIGINLVLTIGLLVLAPILFSIVKPEVFSGRIWFVLGVAGPILFALIIGFSILGFRKKGFAFREHDVLFKHGVIALNITIIPYNRIQHVALHEGMVSRYFGLAKIQIFTAGGSSSDLEIPGIEKELAENIKQLVMGKIQKQL